MTPWRETASETLSGEAQGRVLLEVPDTALLPVRDEAI